MVARRALVAGAAALVVIAFAASRLDQAPVEAVLPTSVRSLAVVAVADTADTTAQQLSHGVALQIGRALRSVNGVRVVSAAGRRRLDSPQLSELLNVGAILETRLRRHDERLHLELALKEKGDSTILVRTYRISGEDLRGTEIAAATDVANALRAQLGLPKMQRIRVAETQSHEAHQLVLRALGLLAKGDSRSRTEAAALLEKALRFDERYADVWSELAAIYEATGDVEWAASTATRAIALDSTHAEPHVVLADLHWARRDTAAAEREYVAAIRLDPQLARARYRYSLMLSELKRADEAMREARRAHELEPLAGDVHRNYAQTLARAGRDLESGHELADLRRLTGILQRTNAAPAAPIARKRADNGQQSSGPRAVQRD